MQRRATYLAHLVVGIPGSPSVRIGLACALLASGASRAEIVAHLRWSDPSMLTISARPNRADSMISPSPRTHCLLDYRGHPAPR